MCWGLGSDVPTYRGEAWECWSFMHALMAVTFYSAVRPWFLPGSALAAEMAFALSPALHLMTIPVAKACNPCSPMIPKKCPQTLILPKGFQEF